MSALGTQKLWAVRGRARSAFEISNFKFEMLRQRARICLPAIVGIRWQICQTPRQRIFADLLRTARTRQQFQKMAFRQCFAADVRAMVELFSDLENGHAFSRTASGRMVEHTREHRDGAGFCSGGS